MIAENLEAIRRRISASCRACGRDPGDVALIAVSKTLGAEAIREARDAGQTDFGENYVQELRGKLADASLEGIRWHFIGHLQSNKVKYIAQRAAMIQTVDSASLGAEIERQAARCDRVIDVLVEIHATDEATKSGVAPTEAPALVRSLASFPHLRVCGLMTMGPLADDPELSRPAFAMVRRLGREIEREAIPRVSMRHFSMGMTHDFEIAIAEGATMVRIGTAIFGSRAASR